MNKFLVTVLLALSIFLGIGGAAHAEVALPELRSRVTDTAGLLDPSAADALERSLADYEKKTGHQFALVTLPTIEGQPVEDFSMRLAEKWKIGDSKRDDGLILLVVSQDRVMRIEVGYGLEGAIPDALAARIVRNQLTPAFRAGQFEQGINAAFGTLMKAAEGESVGEMAAPQQGASSIFRVLLKLLPVIIFLGLFILGGGRGGGGGGAAAAGFLLGSLGGRSGGGGGFSGGGFGGGGGGFGGGGASGRW